MLQNPFRNWVSNGFVIVAQINCDQLFFNQVFNQNAELEGISSTPISVSRIKHTSMVEVCLSSSFALDSCQPHISQVRKEGREGAAATGEEIALFSAAFGEQKDIVVDRPFIFVVQDTKNKIPVLVGKITDPTV